jgi:hypothetical protein
LISLALAAGFLSLSVMFMPAGALTVMLLVSVPPIQQTPSLSIRQSEV